MESTVVAASDDVTGSSNSTTNGGTNGSTNGGVIGGVIVVPQPGEFNAIPGATASIIGDSTSLEGEGTGVMLPPPPPKKKKVREGMAPLSHVAFGIKADTLGIGVEMATPLSRSFNLRTGVNLLNETAAFNLSGVNYNLGVHFKSEQASIDWFPFHGGFHISPGILYFNNSVAGVVNVQPGQTFSWGDTPFINSLDDPVTGTASVTYSKRIAPMVMFGFSNIIPRKHKHFSMPFEFGVAYTGAATIKVNVTGTACTNQGCFDITKDPDSQASLQQEISNINEDLKRVQVYPVISTGFAFKF